MDLLKLVALDPEDLAVISAHLQDAIVRVGDIACLPQGAALRPRRTPLRLGGRARDGRRRRRLAGLHFERVTAVRVRGIDLAGQDAVLIFSRSRSSRRDAPSGNVDA